MRSSLFLLPIGTALVHAQSLRTLSLTACATQSGVVNCLRDGSTVPWTTLSSAATTVPSTTVAPSTTPAEAPATPAAITDCHMHGETQFCFAGDAEYEVLATATATEELPSEYTGCHAHGADMFCLDPQGEEVEVIAEGAHDEASHEDHASGTNAPATTSAAATHVAETSKVTALSGCHMHETQQFCMGPSATEYLMKIPATATGELPTQYTGCHAHGSQLFCMSPAGGEVFAQAQTADGEEPAGEVSADGVSCHFHAGVEHCVDQNGNTVEGTCEAINRDYNIPLRIGLVFAILATSSIGVFAPIFLSLARFKNGGIAMSVVKQFGTGVIISTALVHLFTHAELMFANHCLGGLKYEATTAAIVMAGIVLSFVPEYVGARIFLWRLSKHTTAVSPTPPEQSLDPKSAEANEAPVSHHLIHSGDAHAQSPALQKLKVTIMEAGIIFHSLLIGLTLVVAGDSGFITLFIVIIFHQMFEGLALGSRISDLQIRMVEKLLMATAFAIVTPIGMAIGIGVLNQFNGNDPSTIIAIGTLDALSAGILLDHGPFDVPDFWRASTFSLPDAPGETLFTDTRFELPLINHHFDTELQLPDLDDFQFGKLDDLHANHESDQAPAAIEQETATTSQPDELDDLWKLDLTTPAKYASLRTWEAFAHEHYTESPISYLSDAGPRAFDALQPDDSNVLQSAFTLKCLALLGLGRSSTLFQSKKEDKTFVPTLDNVRLSGLSSTAYESLVQQLTSVGCAFVDLRHFVQSSYANKHLLAARVALATTVQAVLEALDQTLSGRVLTVTSFLQLLACFETPAVLLKEMKELIRATSGASTDTAFLSACHDTIQRFTNACSQFQSLHAEILKQFDLPAQDDIFENSAHISAEDNAQITEVMTGITVLKDAAPDHPLSSPASWGVDSLELELSHTSVDFDRIVDKANKYQQDLLLAIGKYNRGDSKPHDADTQQQPYYLTSEQLPWSLDEGQQTYFEDVGIQFAEPPGSTADTSGTRLLTAEMLEADRNQETSTLDLRHLAQTTLHHVQPYLRVQSCLLNGALLRLLFRQFSLRDNLNLNHSFHLLGNGMFVQRLTAALFTSETNARGLRLDNRSKQWPPASSELRLGLMGVLSEAYGSNDILGNLSFAIRELSDAEIEKCLDANSIHALDFLRLRYEASTPLNVILDDDALAKYDDCFRVLLGMLRMLHFVTLLRSTARQKISSPALHAFAHESWSCVSGLASYLFDIGVAGPWKEFQRILDTIEADLAREDEEGTFGQRVTFGISHLRDKHNDMLDTIRSRLFLRSRHDKLRKSIEDIFGLVLSVHPAMNDEQFLWKQRDGLRESTMGLKNALDELTRKIGKKKVLGSQDRDDVFAVEVLRFRLGGD
ncbi:Zip-domain-containing protein, partial [Aureobasidium melanogenum]